MVRDRASIAVDQANANTNLEVVQRARAGNSLSVRDDNN